MQPPKRRRSYSRKELSVLYEVSPKIFSKWIRPFSSLLNKPVRKRFFTIAEVDIIFEKLGSPFE